MPSSENLPNESKTSQPGIYILDSVIRDLRLSLSDKVLLSCIHSLDNESHCYASNKRLATMTGIAYGGVSNSLRKLKNLGLVRDKTRDTRRFLASDLSSLRAGPKKGKPVHQMMNSVHENRTQVHENRTQVHENRTQVHEITPENLDRQFMKTEQAVHENICHINILEKEELREECLETIHSSAHRVFPEPKQPSPPNNPPPQEKEYLSPRPLSPPFERTCRPPMSYTPVNPEAHEKLNLFLDAIAVAVGARDRHTLADVRQWEDVCMKAIREERTIPQLVQAATSELERNRDTPQFFSAKGVLKLLQTASVRPQIKKFTH